eukprot:scaffold29753_cov22-Tisochrysis_lutea.AAC.4
MLAPAARAHNGGAGTAGAHQSGPPQSCAQARRSHAGWREPATTPATIVASQRESQASLFLSLLLFSAHWHRGSLAAARVTTIGNSNCCSQALRLHALALEHNLLPTLEHSSFLLLLLSTACFISPALEHSSFMLLSTACLGTERHTQADSLHGHAWKAWSPKSNYANCLKWRGEGVKFETPIFRRSHQHDLSCRTKHPCTCSACAHTHTDRHTHAGTHRLIRHVLKQNLACAHTYRLSRHVLKHKLLLRLCQAQHHGGGLGGVAVGRAVGLRGSAQ